jgi:hypothetical protein
LNRCKVTQVSKCYPWKWSTLHHSSISISIRSLSMTANFHGQTSDSYAYFWMVQGRLFSWITLWNMRHTLNRCKVAYCNGKRDDSYPAWDRSHDVFHENKLPYISSMYDTGFKVLSMKINYLAPFKHKHKHQKFAHGLCLNGAR